MMYGTEAVGLFNVESDRGELVNRLRDQPYIAAELSTQLLQWNRQNCEVSLPVN